MNRTEMRDLDRVIEEALRSEPLRPVPAGFHAHVLQKVQGTAMMESDRQGLQFRFAAAALVFAALGASLFVVPFFSLFLAWAGNALPGGMGYFSQVLMFVMQSNAVLVTAIAIGGLLAIIGLATVVGVWAVRYRRAHGYRAT